jgi:NAD(P)-dependent dehydrogenase (short-subunit alcohol dehydrogenase family)
MTNRFSGKVVLVTGGGTGIGQATAQAFAAEGATVVVAGPEPEPLAGTVKLITADGGLADSVLADVTVEDQVRQAVAAVTARHGRLDVAFNNAGLMIPGRLADLEADQFRTAMLMATGTWLSMKHEIAAMREGGAIINMASIIGTRKSIPGTGAYGAAKAAITSITRTAAVEHIADGIRINSVSPGPVGTPFSLLRGETESQQAARMKTTLPIGRIGTVAEIASTVLWLASDAAGFVVGADIVLDGGATA